MPENPTYEEPAKMFKKSEKKAIKSKHTKQTVIEWRMSLILASVFLLLVTLVWLVEIFDFPHLLLGAVHTPMNLQEALIETIFILTVGFFTVLILIRNMSKRKRAETSLRQERDFSKTLIDASPAFFVAIDTNYKTLAMNKTMLQTLGYNLDEVVGTDYLTMFIPEDRQKKVSEVFKTLVKNYQPTMNENYILAKDGRKLLIEWHGRPIFNERNELEFFFGVGIDITKRRRFELDIQGLREELVHVSRVTSMGELVASLAHELNQPLTAILSNIQAAQRFLDGKNPNPDELRDILVDIVKDDKRAVEVIKKLRALLKKDVTEYQPLDINKAIKEVISLIQSDVVRKDVSIASEFATDLPSVSGDRILLQQVILNLIMNGSEAMMDTEPTLRKLIIRTERQDKQNVKVAVQDFGTGLQVGKIENIFEPFYTTKSKGMGMGLSISRSIIEAHGGLLQAENNPDKGATFWFTIPVGKLEVS